MIDPTREARLSTSKIVQLYSTAYSTLFISLTMLKRVRYVEI